MHGLNAHTFATVRAHAYTTAQGASRQQRRQRCLSLIELQATILSHASHLAGQRIKLSPSCCATQRDGLLVAADVVRGGHAFVMDQPVKYLDVASDIVKRLSERQLPHYAIIECWSGSWLDESQTRRHTSNTGRTLQPASGQLVRVE